MKLTTILARVFLPILRVLLTPFYGLRLLLIKVCILLEEKQDPEKSLRWLFEVHSFVEEWIDRQAMAWGKGVHMKHQVMEGIHSFFYERIPENATVLDVGCGGGALANAIVENVKHAKVIGIDHNADHIRFAGERFNNPNLRFIEGDATHGLPGESVNIVVMSSVLEHVVDRVGLLKALQGVYSPICFLIRVPTSERHFHAAMKKHLGIFSYVDRDHKTEYTLASFYEEMNNAGLSIVSNEIRWGDIWAECRSIVTATKNCPTVS